MLSVKFNRDCAKFLTPGLRLFRRNLVKSRSRCVSICSLNMAAAIRSKAKNSGSQNVSRPDHVQEKFTAALDELVEQVKRDRSVLAAILCGSLSHDAVWAKSDIDLVLVTIDDKNAPGCDLALYAGGLNVHAMRIPRTEFRKIVEGSVGNSIAHSFLAKGRLLYTHDDTIDELCSRLHLVGDRDTQVQLLAAAAGALPAIYKAHKWLITRGDLDYTALWILYAATPLAKIEVLSARLLVDREVLPQAMKLNPDFFRIIYADLLNNRKTRAAVQAALSAIDDYVQDARADPVWAWLSIICGKWARHGR